jgi:phenylacetate-coenzyme A ligase PaaK-like adenylate-forming protein
MDGGLDVETILRSCDAMAQEIFDKAQGILAIQTSLYGVLGDEAQAGLEEIGHFMRRSSLESKLLRELGTLDPFTPRRFDYHHPRFESWAPLGLLVHIAPGNAFAVGILSVIEGLLAGNVNVLKLSSADSEFPLLFLERLAALDPTRKLGKFIFAVRVSSSETALMTRLLSEATGVAAWGGEDAIAAIKKMAPPNARVIDWGHRLSFAYVSRGQLNGDTTAIVKAIAKDVCLLEQQACSSPQCVYVDLRADDPKFAQFADQLAKELKLESERLGAPDVDAAQAAEISMVTSVQKAEAALGLGRVIEGSDHSWRVLVDHRSALRASPLYRSVWVKPLPKESIFQTLWPMREFLQTASIACLSSEIAELSAKIVSAGVLRVTEVGEMLGSYDGEPHDGVYALTRYARRISYQLPTIGGRFVSFSDLKSSDASPPWASAAMKPGIMGKEQFQAQEIDAKDSELFFKSGGSSGEPKISVFTYRDYHTQMQLAGEGLIAAGFEPSRDRCMNLFFGGGLYGGFLSFFTILEHLRAVQFPMSAHMDLGFVGDIILKYNVNTLLGMPSYLIQLFQAPENYERLKKSRVVKKILYGGEHFSLQQREHFKREFGVELIRSATYGSVDSGPMGYQCDRCQGTIHHLHHRLQMLEILRLDEDKPVVFTQSTSEVGRLVFTSLARHGQALHRYDIGDLGRWVAGPCECGRAAPRFELMGRSGDIFRAGGSFLNFQKIANIVRDSSAYAGEIQIIIDSNAVAGSRDTSTMDRLRIVMDPSANQQRTDMRNTILTQYTDLNELVIKEATLQLEIITTPIQDFERTAGSGKLLRVVDQRKR